MEYLPSTDDTLFMACPASAPSADKFPTYPRSWYLFGPAAEVRNKPVSKPFLGRELVAFRTSSGRLAVLDARCSHQGADLGRGKVVGEAVRCPYHNWEYGPNGRCVQIPSQQEIPAFAEQASYPAVERHGYLYIFLGPKALFELPFFAGCPPEDYIAGKVFHFIAECSWFMFAANVFDEQHWLTQHQRRLAGPLEIDSAHPLSRRVRFEADVVGSSFFDRLLRRAVGNRVWTSITCWGGNFFFATGKFRHAESYVHVVTRPLDTGRLRVDVIVFMRRLRHRALAAIIEPVSLWLRRRFTHAFMRGEFEELAGIRYSPQSLIESDRQLIEFFRWAAALPGDRTPVARAPESPSDKQPTGQANWDVGSPQSDNF